MPDTAYYILTVTMSVMSFMLGLRVGQGSRKLALVAFGGVLMLLLFKAYLNHHPALEAALFPWEDYLFFQGYALFPPALFTFGLATAVLPRGRNRRACAMFAILLLCVSLFTERWMLLPHELPASGRVADAHHHLPQSTGYSCAPACCVMLLSYWDVDANEPEMATFCRTLPNYGTTFFNLYRGLRLKLSGAPYRVRIVEESPEELRARAVPAIMMNGRNHVVCVSFGESEVVLHDPQLSHHQPISFSAFRKEYGGAAVVVERLPVGNGATAGFTSAPSMR